LDPDLVIVAPTLLSRRWDRHWARLLRRLRPVADMSAHKVMAPQDEYMQPDRLCEFVEEFDVDTILSLAAPSQWATLYGPVLNRVAIHRVLPGYVDEHVVGDAAEHGDHRPIDISYRAWRSAAWTGRHGQIKVEVGERVKPVAVAAGLRVDISNDLRDTLLGDRWTKLLASSRWVLGVEGGSSLMDRDGSILTTVDAYAAARPTATFAEIAEACFPGLDGNLDYRSISPRHFEAASSRTGQILVRGDYNGLMKADEHYLALEPDFSNVTEVVQRAQDEGLRRQLVDRAYRDLIGSGAHTYRSFVEDVLAWTAIAEPREHGGSAIGAITVRLLDWVSWRWVGLRDGLRRLLVLPLRRRRARLRDVMSERA
jgi:hypothetical protein